MEIINVQASLLMQIINISRQRILGGSLTPVANKVVDKWQKVSDGNSSCVYESSGGLNNSAALKITSDNNGSNAAWVLSDLYASPNTDYELTGYYYSDGAEATKAHAELVYYDTYGNIIKIDDTGALGHSGSGWKQFTLKSHSPADAASMEIRLSQKNAPGMTVKFDGIRLKVPGLNGQYDYTGKREDEGIGLKYFGARFYDPVVGMFISQDPIKDGRNWFAYCNNNPINFIDPDGYKPVGSSTFNQTKYCTKEDEITGYKLIISFGGFIPSKTIDFLGKIGALVDEKVDPYVVIFEQRKAFLVEANANLDKVKARLRILENKKVLTKKELEEYHKLKTEKERLEHEIKVNTEYDKIEIERINKALKFWVSDGAEYEDNRPDEISERNK